MLHEKVALKMKDVARLYVCVCMCVRVVMQALQLVGVHYMYCTVVSE